MGICVSSNFPKDGERMMNWPSTAMVIHLDGSHQEFRHPIEARHVLSQNPDCFLCCSESMYVHSPAPKVSGHDELQLGQIYFLMPISKSGVPLSLQDLGALALKATALGSLLPGGYLSRNSKVDSCCRIPAEGFSGVNFPVAHGDQGNYPVL